MRNRDLCGVKKFPDLEDDFSVTINKKTHEVITLTDEKKNVWMRKKLINEGGYGQVVEYKSHNKEYTDLAIKFFIAEGYEGIQDMNQEVMIINLFNKYKCKNFLNSGILEMSSKNKLIIMEKVDGDVTNLDFDKYENPIKVYAMFVNFVLSGFSCGLKNGKYYVDIKEENVGFKLCDKLPKFTFLDFGSFVDFDEKEIGATYFINKKAYDNGTFSNEILTVFGTIMMFLNVRMKIYSKKSGKKFEDFIDNLMKNKKYPRGEYLLSEEYYDKIKEEFFKYFKKEDEFVDKLFKCLKMITVQEIPVEKMIKMLHYYDE